MVKDDNLGAYINGSTFLFDIPVLMMEASRSTKKESYPRIDSLPFLINVLLITVLKVKMRIVPKILRPSV